LVPPSKYLKNINRKCKWYVFFVTLVCAMGGLLLGYDCVVIGGTKPFYEQYFGIAGVLMQQGWAMSCALVGCLKLIVNYIEPRIS
jgi:hypothetical protein